jgi:chromatin segregation and condensation protein Rec8/ScpA/Scc1 (kleisin family)
MPEKKGGNFKAKETALIEDEPNEPAPEEASSLREASSLPKQPQESDIIRTIVLGSDWEEALTSIVVEQGLDPLNIDITRLSDAFTLHLQRLQGFDFRIPGRFILIASILLSMKAEALLSHEEERLNQLKAAAIDQLNLDSPMLLPPPHRTATRPVGLTDLISALNKAFEIKAKKEPILLAKRRIPNIPIPNNPEDIEGRIESIYHKIQRKGVVRFSDLVPVWKRKEIISTFLPLLHLCTRGKASAHQPAHFKEIVVKLR